MKNVYERKRQNTGSSLEAPVPARGLDPSLIVKMEERGET